MGLVLTDDRHYKAIAVTIRENAPIKERMTTADMPGHIAAACEYNHGEGYSSGVQAGIDDGYADGYSDGYEDGYVEGLEEGGGHAVVEPKDVNFYDCDATLLYSYTVDEVQSLTELPPLPNHEDAGLICEGWSWSLSDLKAYAKPNDIMPFYITNDGATWYDLVNDTGRDVIVTFTWRQYSYLDAPVMDFGDGSEPFRQETISADGEVVSVSHTYPPGEYRAKINGQCTLGTVNAVSDISETSSVLLRRVFLGTVTYLYSYAFRGCFGLETFTTPQQCTVSAAQMFNTCYRLVALQFNPKGGVISSTPVGWCSSLRVLSIPNGTTSWHGANALYSLKRLCLPDTALTIGGSTHDSASLASFNIPHGVKSLPANFLLRCYSLTTLTVPSSVTSVAAGAFGTCTGLATLRFEAATPPTVANANAFTGIPAACVIEVPSASLDAYKNATNYGGVAAQMVGV